MSVTSERRVGLDLLRALAVLMVVAAHGSVLAVPLWVPGAEVVFVAFLGVELFFVLSGFLVGGLLLEDFQRARSQPGQRWVGRFWARRWLRTLPSYYLILVLNLVFARSLGAALPEQWPAYFLFVQNLYSPHPEFFGEAWSLAVEEWFYLLAPAVALTAAPLMRSPRAVMAGFALLLLGFLGARVGVALALDPAWDAGVRKLTALRLDSIAYGVLIAWLFLRRPQALQRSGLLACIGLCLVALGAVGFLSADVDDSLFARSLLFSIVPLGCALLLPWAAALRRPAPLSWPLRVAGRLAVLAYALYLVHMFFVNGYLAWADMPETAVEVLGRLGVFVVGSLLAASALYYGFERPVLRLRDRWVPR